MSLLLRPWFIGVASLFISIGCDPICPANRRGPDNRCLETYEANCSDGIDDDGNGRVDCMDALCKNGPECPHVPPEICNNLLDDDSDGFPDCEDDECVSANREFFSDPDPACDCFPGYPSGSTDECAASGEACYVGPRDGISAPTPGCVSASLFRYRLILSGTGNFESCEFGGCQTLVDVSAVASDVSSPLLIDAVTFSGSGYIQCSGSDDSRVGTCDEIVAFDQPGQLSVTVFIGGGTEVFSCSASVHSVGSIGVRCEDVHSSGWIKLGFEPVLPQ